MHNILVFKRNVIVTKRANILRQEVVVFWNMVHGNTPEQVMQDEEGLQIMRVLGRNMAFLVRAIATERDAGGLPAKEPERTYTNFIR